MELYDSTAIKISKTVTESYSTSFSMATALLEKEHRNAIYSIYGFVRLADEIVDTFHAFPKKDLLEKLETDVQEALNLKISANPILHAFQLTVHKYKIPYKFIDAFLASMRKDLSVNNYSLKKDAEEYIYGSADVVGLMCLKVFVNGCPKEFARLEQPAMKLGSAFQKVNFLRDLKQDSIELGRNYFPELTVSELNAVTKKKIINSIESDFNEAFKGIKELPDSAKTAVLAAYFYYRKLLDKISQTPPDKIISTRMRISNRKKITLLIKARLMCTLKLI